MTIFAKRSILDAWQNSEFSSKASNNLRKKPYLRCLRGFWIHLCIIFANLLPICLLNLVNIFKQIQYCARSKIHVTLCSTYLLNNENHNSVSSPCVSIDYVFTSVQKNISKFTRKTLRGSPTKNLKTYIKKGLHLRGFHVNLVKFEWTVFLQNLLWNCF